MKNKAIVLVGMHRSGSSAAMGILRILGVDIGDELMPANAFNPKGYLENLHFVHFEEKLLHDSGGDWMDIVPEEKVYDTFNLHHQDVGFDLLVKAYDRSSIWGYKAIRGGLFPEILTRIPNLHLIITLRSPLAVASSLKRRDRLALEQSLLLWSTYYNRIFQFVSRHPEVPFIIVNYNDLIDHLEDNVEKIAQFLGVEVTEKQTKETKAWIEKTLRHQEEIVVSSNKKLFWKLCAFSPSLTLKKHLGLRRKQK